MKYIKEISRLLTHIKEVRPELWDGELRDGCILCNNGNISKVYNAKETYILKCKDFEIIGNTDNLLWVISKALGIDHSITDGFLYKNTVLSPKWIKIPSKLEDWDSEFIDTIIGLIK